MYKRRDPKPRLVATKKLLLIQLTAICQRLQSKKSFCSSLIEMGSLMAGWDSPVLGDDDKVRARRMRSLTKEEVDAFWKQRGRAPEDHGGGGGEEISPFGSLEKTPRSPPGGGVMVQTGGPSSPAARVEGFRFPGGADETRVESPSTSRDWWTRSSWAFLNEPPQEEAAGSAQSYKPQFHVARIATAGNA